MIRPVLVSLLLTALASLALAEEKKAPAPPLGTWERQAAGSKITFTFTPDMLRVQLVTSSGDTIDAKTAYGIAPDGTVFGLVTSVEKEGDGPEKGNLFRFQARVSGNTLTISDLAGTNIGAEAGQLINGEYTRKSK